MDLLRRPSSSTGGGCCVLFLLMDVRHKYIRASRRQIHVAACTLPMYMLSVELTAELQISIFGPSAKPSDVDRYLADQCRSQNTSNRRCSHQYCTAASSTTMAALKNLPMMRVEKSVCFSQNLLSHARFFPATTADHGLRDCQIHDVFRTHTPPPAL